MKKKFKYLLPFLCMATLLFGSLTVSAASKEFTQDSYSDTAKTKCNELLKYCNDNNIVTSGKSLIYDVKNGKSELRVISNLKFTEFNDSLAHYTYDSEICVWHSGSEIEIFEKEPGTNGIWKNSYFANFDYDDGNNCIVANKDFFPVPPVVAPAENLTGMVVTNLKVIIPVAVFCLSCMICLYLLARKLKIFL